MKIKPINLLCAALGGLVFTGSVWLMGIEVPDHRSFALWAYCFYTVCAWVMGYMVSQFFD